MKKPCLTNPGVLCIDIETYSETDLQKAGLYKYAEDPAFQIILFAYAYDNGPVQVIDLTAGHEIPRHITQDIQNPEVIKKAHNAAFERVCLSRYMRDHVWPMDELQDENRYFLSPEGWCCTMVHASMCGLPASLAQVGDAIGLAEDKKKLDTGKAMIRYFCQPCKPTKANGQRTRNLPKHDRDKWAQFCIYNRQDVEAERAIENKLNSIYKMPQNELELYWLDQKINDTGVRVDTDMVKIIQDRGNGYSETLAAQAAALGKGINIQSVAQLKEWLSNMLGHPVTSLTKETIPELIKEADEKGLQTAGTVLTLRQEAGKLSVKKYDVFTRATCSDGRIHGCFQFYGSRTGRWAGRLVQPQNLPRNSFNDFDNARKLVKAQDWEMLSMCYPNTNDVFSTLIRTALVPKEGCRFAVADYSAIEARVIAWLADERWVMQAFHEGKDIYCQTASQMFGVPVEKHGANSDLRKKGKIAVLACGYGGSVGAMKAFGADKMGLSDADIQDIVNKWRTANSKTYSLWRKFDKAAETALNHPKVIVQGPKNMKLFYTGCVLKIKLPSGRLLVYQNPRYTTKKDGKTELTFSGLNQTTRKWGPIFTWGGKITENVIQAIARDCLAVALTRMDKAGYTPVMHIHDEVVVEVPQSNAEKHLEKIEAIMAEPIDWAPGLELTAAGFVCDYYQKD